MFGASEKSLNVPVAICPMLVQSLSDEASYIAQAFMPTDRAERIPGRMSSKTVQDSGLTPSLVAASR